MLSMTPKPLFRSLLALAILAWPLAGQPVAAQPVAAQSVEDIVRLELRPGWRTDSGSHMTALHVTLAPGWKTYWRVPGDSGIPPVFDFAGSDNLSRVAVHWPRPSVHDSDGLETVGYTHELVLPVEIWPTAPGTPVTLRGQAMIGVCRDICLPVDLAFAGALPQDGGAPDAVIRAALDTVPGMARAGAARCGVAPIADGLRLDMTLDVPAQGGDERVYVETGRADLWTSPAVVVRDGTRLTAAIDLVPPEARPFALDRGALRITVLGDKAAIEMRGCQSD